MISAKNILFIASLTLLSISAISQENEEAKIIGTWISQEDGEWRIEFRNDGKCYWLYTEEDNKVFNYSISTTSPQCGKTVDVGPLFSYLRLETVENSSEMYCYEIAGVNDEFLSLIFLGGIGYKPMVFSKWQ